MANYDSKVQWSIPSPAFFILWETAGAGAGENSYIDPDDSHSQRVWERTPRFDLWGWSREEFQFPAVQHPEREAATLHLDVGVFVFFFISLAKILKLCKLVFGSATPFAEVFRIFFFFHLAIRKWVTTFARTRDERAMRKKTGGRRDSSRVQFIEIVIGNEIWINTKHFEGRRLETRTHSSF